MRFNQNEHFKRILLETSKLIKYENKLTISIGFVSNMEEWVRIIKNKANNNAT